MRRALASIALLLAACPDKGSQPPGDERLLAKLKAEKEREAKEGPMVPPTAVEALPKDEVVNPLAEFAAKGTQKRELPLPAKTLVTVGKVALRLNGLEAGHTVGERVSVTTDELFLHLEFSASGPDGASVDLSRAHLELGTRTFAFARDAQAASRKSAMVAASRDGAVVSAYFEVAPDALAKGLTLVVPAEPEEARLELQ